MRGAAFEFDSVVQVRLVRGQSLVTEEVRVAVRRVPAGVEIGGLDQPGEATVELDRIGSQLVAQPQVQRRESPPISPGSVS